MAAERHTFELLARHLIRAFAPLAQMGDPGAYRQLMARLGFVVTTPTPAMASLSVNTKNASVQVDASAAPLPLTGAIALLGTAKSVFDGIQSLTSSPPPELGAADKAAFTAEIGTSLVDLLIGDYLAARLPGAFNILGILNVAHVVAAAPTATRPAAIRPRFDWPELPKVFSSASDLPLRAFQWGQPDFSAASFFDYLTGFLLGLQFPVSMREPENDRIGAYLGLPDFESLAAQPLSLHLPFYASWMAGNTMTAEFRLHALPAAGASLPGIVFESAISANVPLQFALHPKVAMRLLPGSNAGLDFGIALAPGRVTATFPLAPAAPPPPGGFGVGFDFKPDAPTVLLGDPTASRLEFAGASIDLRASFTNGAWSTSVGADLKGLRFVFDPGEGDGFLKYLLGPAKTVIGLPLALQWTGEGIRFGGTASFDVVVHPHVSIGPVAIDEVEVRLGVPLGGKPRVLLELGASISTEIGPISMMLKGVGFRVNALFEKGNAGPFDVSVGFKPPDGIRIAVDGGGFKGGGYLEFLPDRGEYAGTLELTFAEFVSVRAVGILSTRLPDGRDAFSLLIIIVSEFIPIQLSFGFTLLGVGGLLGLSRTVNLDVLQLGVRDGTLNSILFPTDVLANAPRIISDLKRVFPPMEDRFLIGPMGKVGWGTPTIVSLELGLLLEIPRPGFAILGVLRVQLPAEDFGVLYLQVNFVGSIDFEKGQLQFDASLYNSRVLIFPLTGDMAVRLYWGRDANFLLTVGGFHPAYTPPPMNIGQLQRLGITIAAAMPRVKAEAYFAITSNTVQFGARVEVLYGIKAFNVYGFVGLDVLIQFNPFQLIAEIAAMFAVRSGSDVLFSIQVKGTLKGPTPWHVRGEGSFHIGFIIKVKISADFEVTVGEERKVMLPAIDALGEIHKALDAIGNWRALLPRGSNQHVTLRELPAAGATLVLHPFGALAITQKVAPLNLPIQRLGSSRPDKGSTFRITASQINGADTKPVASQEQFAPAQYFQMNDAEKLSRPSFANYDAGVILGSDTAPQTDFRRGREVLYEVVYLPEHHPLKLLYKLPVGLFSAFARGGSAAQSVLSQEQRVPSPVAAAPAVYAAEKYAVASAADLTLHGAAFVFDTATAADHAMSQIIASAPELFGTVQVVPHSQVRSVA